LYAFIFLFNEKDACGVFLVVFITLISESFPPAGACYPRPSPPNLPTWQLSFGGWGRRHKSNFDSKSPKKTLKMSYLKKNICSVTCLRHMYKTEIKKFCSLFKKI
jgi:hypothetical protein